MSQNEAFWDTVGRFILIESVSRLSARRPIENLNQNKCLNPENGSTLSASLRLKFVKKHCLFGL